MWRSLAIICCGWESRTFLPPCIWNTSIPASNSPEQIRINAIRSRCALFIFAWILNTNAEKSPSSIGSISPLSDFLGSGDVVILRKCFKNVSTPKFVRADPKNTGESSPLLTISWSSSAPAPSWSSISSSSFAFCSSLMSPFREGSSIGTICTSPCVVPFLVSENNSTLFVARS